MRYIAERGEISLSAETTWLGEDLCVLITGGEAHIGSVSTAVPRPSLADAAQSSATVSTFNYTGHKDDQVGNIFAHALSARLGRNVVAVCGIHYDHLPPEGIAAVAALSKELLEQVLNGETAAHT